MNWFRNPHFFLTLILACFLTICGFGLRRHSATYDEPVYIASGMAIQLWSDVRLKPDTPPLTPFLAALGVRLYQTTGSPLNSAPLFSALQGSAPYDVYDVSRAYVHSAVDIDSLLSHTRIAFIAIGALGIFYTFLLVRFLSSSWAGLFAAFLLAMDPTWQAHASIVACDVPLAAFFIMTIYHFMAYASSPRHAHAILLTTGLMLAHLAKYNAPMIFPILAVLYGLGFGPVKAQLRVLCLWLTGGAGLFLVILWMLYGTPAGIVAFVAGFTYIYKNVPASNMYYLMGNFRAGTWFYYYPLATLIKLPVLSLLAILGGAGLTVINKNRWRSVLPLAIPIVMIYGISLFDQTNYCMRRVLPAYPFLYAFSGFLLSTPWVQGRVSVWLCNACTAIVAVSLVSGLLIFPDEMSFIGAHFGGSRCGPYLLADCNLDWGQDLPALADYQSHEAIDRIAFGYFGQGDPTAYGLKVRPMGPDEWTAPRREVYAVSVNFLIYQQLDARRASNPALDWLARFEPTAKAGSSIYVYDFREPNRVVEKTAH